MTFIVAALTVSMALLIWFNTNAFCEYMCLFRLSRWFHIRDYKLFTGSCDAGSFLSYPKFLFEFYPNFATRLLNCPICVSVWLGALASLCLAPASYCLAISFVGLNLYLLSNKLVGSSNG